jgi:hypothetical protein
MIQMPPGGTLVSNRDNTIWGLLDNQNVGGTFPATGNTLSSVTIYTSRNGPNSNKYRAFVLGTDDNGVPVFPILWQSADQLSPNDGSIVPVTFTPNIPIQIGRRYFFGVDSGRVTSVDSNPQGVVNIWLNDSNSIPEGSVWEVPEPSTLVSIVTSALLFRLSSPRARTLRRGIRFLKSDENADGR